MSPTPDQDAITEADVAKLNDDADEWEISECFVRAETTRVMADKLDRLRAQPRFYPDGEYIVQGDYSGSGPARAHPLRAQPAEIVAGEALDREAGALPEVAPGSVRPLQPPQPAEPPIEAVRSMLDDEDRATFDAELAEMLAAWTLSARLVSDPEWREHRATRRARAAVR